MKLRLLRLAMLVTTLVATLVAGGASLKGL